MVIVDASVAVKWVLPEIYSDEARALTFQTDMASPSFWRVEAASVLWKRHRKGELSQADIQRLLARLSSIGVRSEDDPSDVDAALGLAARIPHSVYDCLYLAVAIRLDTILVTADDRFIQGLAPCSDLARRAVHIGDYV